MKIFLPAVGPANQLGIFEVQTLIIEDGDFQVIITGNVLNNITEEINIIFSLLRVYGECFGVDKESLKKKDYHIHINQLKYSKEGESSGVAIFLSLICAIKEWNRNDFCLVSGEIDLYGNILYMENIDKKIAVNQDGFDYIIIPKSCVKDELKNNKIYGMENIFELYEFMEKRENEMVNL